MSDNKILKSIGKGILIFILIIIILIAGIVIFINLAVRPVPEHKRNISTTDVKLDIEFSHKEETRTPIIRTYREEEFINLDQRELEKVMDVIDGNIEGDIPAIHIKDENNIIYFSFIKGGKQVDPDFTPKIRIEIPTYESSATGIITETTKIIEDKLDFEEGRYSYRLQRYITQYEKYFMQYSHIKISYQVDGEKYISLFGLNASNVDDGVDFFDNEYLDNPIESDVETDL